MISLGEEDGQALLAGFVHDASRDAAELLVLDADDLAGRPVAKLRVPVQVPYGLHGPGSRLEGSVGRTFVG